MKAENERPSTLDKVLAAGGIFAELSDMAGDITYLVYFPHIHKAIVWILSYSLFLPFGITFAYLAKVRGSLTCLETLKRATMYYFGFAAFDSSDTFYLD